MDKYNQLFIITILCALFLAIIPENRLNAQIPNGYYNTANGLEGDALKEALHEIINDHIEFPYTSSSTDTWDILKEADRDPNNSNNVLGIYSGFSMNAALEYNNGNGWNREHVWPQSRGDFGTSKGAGTDIHHLRASDISTNSARSNRNFDEATTPYTDASGQYSGSTDSFTSSTAWIWEPPDAVKGDIARMMFYMAVRYEGTDGEPDLELTETYQTNTSKDPLHAKFSTLVAWHNQDPVDDQERDRNDIVYSYQQNRNPFIDHPEYVDLIWFPEAADPMLTLDPNILQFDPVVFGNESQVESYELNATDLSEGSEIEVTIPSSQLVLSQDANFNSPINSGDKLSTQNGNLQTTIYIKFIPGVNENSNESFEIAHSSIPSGQVSKDLRISTETIEDLITGIEAFPEEKSNLFYPNPYRQGDRVHLKTDNALSLYTPRGTRIFYCPKACETKLNTFIQGQPVGLYLLKSNRKTQRLIKLD